MATYLQLNTAHRNHILDETGAVFNAGSMRVADAAQSGSNQAAPGNALVNITLPNPAFGSAAAGAMDLTGTWSGTVLATGAPLSFRLINSGATQIREGNAATDDVHTDETMEITDHVDGDLIEGGTLTVTAYVITQPQGSADP